jgi:hypothetical protein
MSFNNPKVLLSTQLLETKIMNLAAQPMTMEELELLTLPNHQSSPSGFSAFVLLDL